MGAKQTPRDPEGRTRRPEPTPIAEGSLVLRNTLSGSIWTVVSRLTGLGKVLAVGAVLGATYLGNTYQAINSLPNLVYYQLLAGSLFASLLVPPLVRHVEQGDRVRAQRLVAGFFGSLLLIAVTASVIILALGPLILHVLTLGVPDRAAAAAQARVGRLFLIMFVPQIVLYVIAGTAAAVMNAHGRFALAAGAPALESLGMIAVLAVAGWVFGTGIDISHVSNAQLLLLGLGTTAAVGLHATCQWWGARASGVKVLPGPGWRDPEVRRVIRRILPTLGYTGLAATQLFAVLIVANRVPGGLVAFQLALNFFYLPTAVVTWPVARALLPHLSHFHHEHQMGLFRDEFLRGVAVASFLTIPIAVLYLVMASPLAQAVAFGQLQKGQGVTMMALSLAALAPAVLGETWFILGTYAWYAQQDARAPLRSMIVRVGVSLGLMVPAWLARGPEVLFFLGTSLSVGSLAGSLHIAWRLRRSMPSGGYSAFRSLGRTAAASLLMLAPAGLARVALEHLGTSRLARLTVFSVTAMVALGAFIGIQAVWRAPELALLKNVLGRFRPAAPAASLSEVTGRVG
jgi:putative peptidoglycan lipid II flippase